MVDPRWSALGPFNLITSAEPLPLTVTGLGNWGVNVLGRASILTDLMHKDLGLLVVLEEGN